ncbi:hypothetical protein QFC21_002071 [Naganishia friedmannii]|uniref:Uncharacterized protein n=1 Tax=Naganishia friedmannii TaxID=89922 RepID=A0ACC2VYW1_9TREE|nr:hypothetical protein QFC21_002071 [Naganishia friedmannii]
MPMDTAEYLASQGWKGKGTALKHGHVTRPLAVVQKKTLGGVGKDRDEAVPFWDNIFAAAAINIKISSSGPGTPVTSGSATPTENPAPPPSIPSSMNAFARSKKESARRLLYSKFLRGKVLVSEELDDEVPLPRPSAEGAVAEGAEAGSSVLCSAGAVGRGHPSYASRSGSTAFDVGGAASGSLIVGPASASVPVPPTSPTPTPTPAGEDQDEGKTTRKKAAEKALRRAAKAQAKAVVKEQQRTRRRAEKSGRRRVGAEPAEEAGKDRRKGKGKDKDRVNELGLARDGAGEEDGKKKRKRSTRDLPDGAERGDGDGGDTDTLSSSPAARKKKRRGGGC